MKRNRKSTARVIIPSILLLLFGTAAGVAAQTTQPQTPAEPPQAQTQNAQANQMPDIGFLNLTPDQIQKIRTINRDLKDERQAANQRLRLAQRALAEAVESPTPDEALIAQRSREVAEAQANTIRLKSLTEARVLQVLTPEQRMRLREMRQRNLARRGGQQQAPNALGSRPGLQRRTNVPLLNPNQRRILRRQQRP